MLKVLIAGNGIAGLTLAWALDRAGAAVTLATDPSGARSTGAAAGVINPVTGKRYVKSWRFEEHHAAARAFYKEIEQYFGVQIWRERPIIRLLGGAEEANNWSRRAGTPEYGHFIRDAADAGPWSPFLQAGYYFGRVEQSAQVDFAKLTDHLVLHFANKGAFRPEQIPFHQVEAELTHYDRIVFCEGASTVANPFFKDLPWQPAKGEGLLVEFQDDGLNRLLRESDSTAAMPMLKKDIVIAAPQFYWDKTCWVGATYSWDFSDHHPTPEAGLSLTESLKKMVHTPFTVKGRFAGIRQITKDRRPVLGASRFNSKIFIFNSLGSKGGLQAPLWAQHLTDHLLDGATLDREVDVARFY